MITANKTDKGVIIIQNNTMVVRFYSFIPLTALLFYSLFSLAVFGNVFEGKLMIIIVSFVACMCTLKMEWKRKIQICKNNIEIIKFPFKKKTSIKFSEVKKIKVEEVQKGEKGFFLDLHDGDRMYKIVLYSNDKKYSNYVLCYSLYLDEINELCKNIFKYRGEVKDG